MKSKILWGVIVLFAVLFLAGCGIEKEEKLSCKATASGVDIEMDVVFKGKTVTSMDLIYEMDLSSYSDEQIKLIKNTDYCERVKNSLSNYKNAFRNCKYDIVNKKLKVESNLDVDTMAKTKDFGSIKNAKEGLESTGYTCTIN